VNTLRDAAEFLLTAENWWGPRGILARLQAHVWISLVATSIAALVAIPSAVLLAHRRRAPTLSVAVVNVGRAVPSFAVVALVLPFSIRWGFGLGFWPTAVALIVLGIPPMFTTTYTGVAGAPAESIEAARGIGMTDRQVLRSVELPAATPLIMTGIRISAVQIVATATLGAVVGYECLGSFIIAGLARGSAGRAEVVAGAFLVAVLALVVDVVLDRAQQALTPWEQQVR
jgi:osmoprotectant transport system permease protein